jgi:cytochrome c biogenesis protein CcdA
VSGAAEIGYAVAFLGGVLTLISPCGALLLPAFFAYGLGGGTMRLAGRTLVFLLGLSTVLVPLGLGAGLLTSLVYRHQDALTTAAGALLIFFGLLVAAGGGFAIPAPPGTDRLRTRLHTRLGARLGAGSGTTRAPDLAAGGGAQLGTAPGGRSSGGPGVRPRAVPPVRAGSVPIVYALGLVSGLGGFCSGPILGAVLTVAAQSGQALRGGVLLAVYATGMTAPLFGLAALWDRYDLGRRRWLRGRGVRLGPLRTHTTALASGLLLVALGGLFAATSGTQALTGWFGGGAGSFESAAEALILRLQPYVPDLAVVGALTLIIAVAAWRLLRRT